MNIVKKRKAPSLTDILSNETDTTFKETKQETVEQETSKENKEAIDKPISKKKDTIVTSIILPLQVKDKLEEIVFSERRSKKSQNDIFLEAIDLLFKDRGFPSIKNLTE